MGQISFDNLFSDDKKVVEATYLLSPIQEAILSLLESGVTSAIEISEKLIQDGKFSNDRFSTNKPKAYPKVCSILEQMVNEGKVIFVEDQNKLDRIYRKG